MISDSSGNHFWHNYSTSLHWWYSTVMLSLFLRHPGLTFQHDNVRSYALPFVINCFQACFILLWLAWSPALTMIEHIWDVMRLIEPPQNIDHLVQQLKNIFHEILQDTSSNFVSLCHAGWRFIFRPELDQHFIHCLLCNGQMGINHSIVGKFYLFLFNVCSWYPYILIAIA